MEWINGKENDFGLKVKEITSQVRLRCHWRPCSLMCNKCYIHKQIMLAYPIYCGADVPTCKVNNKGRFLWYAPMKIDNIFQKPIVYFTSQNSKYLGFKIFSRSIAKTLTLPSIAPSISLASALAIGPTSRFSGAKQELRRAQPFLRTFTTLQIKSKRFLPHFISTASK